MEEQRSWLDEVDRSPDTILGKKFLTDEDVGKGQRHAQLLEEKAEESISSLDVFTTALRQESAASWLLIEKGEGDFVPDPNWSPSDEDIDVWRGGVEERFHDQLGEAVSPRHAEAIKTRLIQTQDRDKIINSHGGGAGIGYRILAGMLDPAALVATVVTDGIAAPYIFASKVGRVANAVRGGLAGVASNVAIDGYLATRRDDMGVDDVIFSMVGGVLLGGAGGALKGAPKAKASPESKWIVETLEDIQNTRVVADLKVEALPLTEKGVQKLGHSRRYMEEIVQASGERLGKQQRKMLDNQIASHVKRLADFHTSGMGKLLKGASKSSRAWLKQNPKEALARGKQLESLEAAIADLKGFRSRDADIRGLHKKVDAQKIILEARMNHVSPEGALRMLRGETLEQVTAKVKPKLKTKTATLSEPRSGISSPAALKGRALASDEGLGRQKVSTEQGERREILEDVEGEEVDIDSPHSDVHIKNMEAELEGQEVGKSYGSKFRVDRASWAGSSTIALARHVNGIIFEDAPGYTNTSLIRNGSASLYKKITFGRIMYHHNKSFQTNFKGWLEAKGESGRFLNFRGDTRKLFNEEVSKAVRGTKSSDKFVNAHAAHQADAYAQMLQEAQKFGVTGVENLEKNLNYLPRIWSAEKLRAAVNEIGEAAVVKKIARALKPKTQKFPSKGAAKTDPPTEADLLRTAQGILNVVRLSRGGGVDIHKVISTTDTARLKSHLRDFDVPEDDIDDFIDTLHHGKQSEDSNVNRLRRRIEMDETMDVSDFFDNNSEGLFHNYANAMTGHIALARQGIRNESDMNEILKRIKQAQGIGQNQDTGSLKNTQVIENLRDGYNHLIGRPLEANTNSTSSHTARLLRKLNFSRLMNQVGLAQIPEVGVAVGQLGFRVMGQHMPEMLKIFSRAQDGKFADELAEELDDWLGGYSSMSLMSPPANQIDEVGSAMRSGGSRLKNMANASEKKLDQLNYAVGHSSGFFGINQVIKNMTMKGMAQKWVNSIDFEEIGHKGKKLTSADRLHDLGVSDEMQEQIKAQIKQHSKLKDGSTKLKNLNLEEWDEEIRDTFVMSMRRWGDGIIQDTDMGSSIKGLDDTITGKLLMQFRGFVTQAWSRHLVKGAKYHDAAFAQEVAFSMMTAALVFQAQQRLTTIGRDDRDEMLEERLSAGSVLANSISRSAFASVVPAIVDSIASPFMEHPIFYRTSGQATGIFSVDSTPTLDLFNDAYDVFGSAAALFDNEVDYTKGNARKLLGALPLGNHLAMKAFWEMMFIDYLPEQH